MDPEYTDKLLATVGAAATSATQDPLVSLHAVYHAIIKGDFEGIGEFMTDDVELTSADFGRLTETGAAEMTWLPLRGRTMHS